MSLQTVRRHHPSGEPLARPPTGAPPRVERTRVRPRTTIAMVVPLQLFLAAGWARAGIEKVIDPQWWNGAHLRDFLEEQQTLMLPFFRPFADHLIEPIAPVVSWLVVELQLAIAILLFVNRHTKIALWAGITLNVAFTMAGRVNPSAFYLVMQLALLIALSRAVTTQIAIRRAVLWLIPAGIVLPFARTLDPAHVIDDPALMLSFVAVLATVTTVARSADTDRLLDLAGALSGRVVARVTGRPVDGARRAGAPVE